MLNMTMMPDLDFRLWRILLFFPPGARARAQIKTTSDQWSLSMARAMKLMVAGLLWRNFACNRLLLDLWPNGKSVKFKFHIFKFLVSLVIRLGLSIYLFVSFIFVFFLIEPQSQYQTVT